MATKFYTLHQINAGGFYIDRDHIAEFVVIKAESESVAIDIADNAGLFDLHGCTCGCGDTYRFSESYIDDELAHDSLVGALAGKITSGSTVVLMDAGGYERLSLDAIDGLLESVAEYDRLEKLEMDHFARENKVNRLLRELAKIKDELARAEGELMNWYNDHPEYETLRNKLYK